MLSEETTKSPIHHPESGDRPKEEHVQSEGATTSKVESVWHKHRILTSLAVVVALVLLTIVIQNPAKTTVDLLLWTVSIRQGMGLALMFVIGCSCGWVTRILYRREHLSKRLG